MLIRTIRGESYLESPIAVTLSVSSAIRCRLFMLIMIGFFPKIRVPHFGVLITRILLFRVLYWGPLFSETPHMCHHASWSSIQKEFRSRKRPLWKVLCEILGW